MIESRDHKLGAVDHRVCQNGDVVPDTEAIIRRLGSIFEANAANPKLPAWPRNEGSPAGHRKYRFLDFCLGDIGNLLHLNARDVCDFDLNQNSADNVVLGFNQSC